MTSVIFEVKCVTVLNHQSYSTDLALSDFFYYAAIKMLASWKYTKRNHLGSATFHWLKRMPEEIAFKG